MMRQRLDVVNHAIRIPLGVHLGLGARRKSVQPPVVPKIAEHRLDYGDAPSVEP